MFIAFVIPSMEYSTGGERQILELCRCLKNNGHRIKIFTASFNKERCHPSLTAGIVDCIVECGPTELTKKFLYWLVKIFNSHESYFLFFLLTPIIKIIKKESNIDLINLHNRGANWIAPFIKYFNKKHIPIIWMANDVPFWHYIPEARNKNWIINCLEWILFGILDKYSLKFIDEVIVLDERNSQLVKKIYKRESKLVRSGVDLQFFKPELDRGIILRKTLGLHEKDFVILQVGTAAGYKSSSDHLESTKYLSRFYPQVKLILAGYLVKKRYGPMTKQLNLDECTILIEDLSDQEVRDLYNCCDVFIFCMDQTWGLAVIEAMSCGKTIITSTKTGVAEIIVNGKNGFIYKFGEPHDLKEKIERLVKSPKLCVEIGSTARKFIEENFSWGKYASDMMRIFEQQKGGRTEL